MSKLNLWSCIVLLIGFQSVTFSQEKKSSQQDKPTSSVTEEKDDKKSSSLDEPKVSKSAKKSDAAQDSEATDEILAGHSYHGDAFNEGPRQSAYLMGGTGKVHFPVTSKHPEVQKFIEQGIGQLHGFWELEAERSFRHAAALDPDCAMAYWGAALATKRNAKRARGFIDKAVERKSKASSREQKYIDALNAYIPKKEKASKDGKKKTNDKGAKEAKKKRAENYTKALENIAIEFPEDLEAKAFLALQLYDNRRDGIPILSYLATDGLMEDIFRQEPMHPTHHFRIHLWDYKKPERAVKSASLCGQSAPNIAHMWHMPGHIFSRLKRYEDAVWQQEASARVDHAHMMRDRVMPDQIHNFAHNNEWMIRNLIFIGAVQKAIDLAKNMSELPRHPKYNTLKKRGSNKYGRERLFQVLNKFGVWDQTVALCDSVYLEPTNDEREQRKRLRALGVALYMNGQKELAEKHLAEIQQIVDDEKEKEKASIDAAVAKAKSDFEAKWAKDNKAAPAEKKSETKEVTEKKTDQAKAEVAKTKDDKKAKALQAAIDKARKAAARKHKSKYEPYEKIIKAIEGFRALKAGDYKTAYDKIKGAGGEDETLLAEVRFLKGEQDQALAEVKKSVDRRKNEVIPRARYAYLLDLAGKEKEAKAAFEELRKISSSIDMKSELFTRLSSLAERCGYPGDWRMKKVLAKDIGTRPNLDDLGPIHWRPSPAPSFELTLPSGEPFRLQDYKGRPLIVIFYLGASCLHCSEQLQAFAPQNQKFENAGIDIVAISTDEQAKLLESLANYGEKMPLQLMSDDKLEVFKKFRVYDDFEKQPLHGTFLIDEDGLVRWQDISYEPFMDHEFLFNESLRLLAQKKVSQVKVELSAK